MHADLIEATVLGWTDRQTDKTDRWKETLTILHTWAHGVTNPIGPTCTDTISGYCLIYLTPLLFQSSNGGIHLLNGLVSLCKAAEGRA